MPNPAATVSVFPREDNRGVDTLDLHAEGLRPNTTFAVFLTELPAPPFGAVQYIGDFTTNAAGRGHVRVDAIINEAFAFNNITGVRTELNHVVFWFADTMMMNSVSRFCSRTLRWRQGVRSCGDVLEEFSSWRATPVTYGAVRNNRVEWDAP